MATDDLSLEQLDGMDSDDSTGDDEDSEVSDSIKAKDLPTCSICLNKPASLISRPCCHLQLCPGCLATYLETKVSEGIVFIFCPGSECTIRLNEYEIANNLAKSSVKKKFHQFLIDAQNDPTMKTCPRCGQERKVKEEDLQTPKVTEHGLPVTCQACTLVWCFSCHAPWHERISCQEFRREDQHFIQWTKRRALEGVNQINAQRCPACKTYIQRRGGCNSMICGRCHTHFCYECGSVISGFGRGDNFLTRLLFGHHGLRWTPLGCPALLWPESPLRRKTIKGLIVGGKVIGAVVTLLLLLILVTITIPLASLISAGIRVFQLCKSLRRFIKKMKREVLLKKAKNVFKRNPPTRKKRQPDGVAQTRQTRGQMTDTQVGVRNHRQQQQGKCRGER